MSDQTETPFTDKPLYKLLTKSFPSIHRRGYFDVRAFAEELEMSAEGVYKWLRANRLSADGANKILALAETKKTTLTREKLIPFVLR